MKKMISLLISLMLLLGALPALAQQTYPECAGTVTDLALVLGDETIRDLEKLNSRYEALTDGRIYLVTRHFLGGRDVNEYAEELFDAWKLQDQDVLMLMVIGEESYAMHLGKKASSALPRETLHAFFATHFHDAFMARAYDKAAGEVCIAALSRIADSQGKILNTAGLFGAGSAGRTLHEYEQELSSLFSTFFEEEEQAEEHPSVLKEDKDTGISIWKILLIFFIVRAIFRKRKRKKRRFLF